MNISKIFLLCLLSYFYNPYEIIGQAKHLNPVNNYISYANESTHGMLIAHRILEGFNQKVNAYVDLQSNQFNFYGNKDLPKDLFEDPDSWFYDISPNTWYKIIQNTNWESPHKAQLDEIANDLNSICQRVNQIRFTMEDYMLNNDLTIIENQVEIFSQLENCASLYDRYYEVNDRLHILIKLIDTDESNMSTSKINYTRIQSSLKASLEKIRYGFDNELEDEIKILAAENKTLQKKDVSRGELRDMKTAIIEAETILDNYKNNTAIPDKYALYGPAYYYYNVELIAVMNQYGKAFVENANKMLLAEDPNQILLLEEPHYFKVILPKKDIPLEQSKNIITKLPSKLAEREIEISQTKIQVKDKKLLLEIFDHRQEDGDIISLNFNGKWILKQKKLRKLPLKLVVELNDTGENYLILHAENLGEIPPNTIAVRYYLDGDRKIVVLNSDLNQSEMIRINRILE